MKNKLRVLVGCEESQAITKAFRELGFEAYSCDLLPASGGHPEWHFQQNVFEVIEDHHWDLMIAHPPCFDKDTLITTVDGLKRIEDIKEGDLVLTHLGRYKKVTKKMVRKTDSYRILKSSNNIETITTDEHPYFVRERKNKKDLPPSFVECKDLDRTYFTGSTYSKKSIPSLFSDEMLYIMGRYVADGHLRKSRHFETGYEEMVLSIGHKKMKDFEGNVTSTKYTPYKERTVYKVKFYSRDFCDLFEQFGKGAENKTIPQWVIDLPTKQLSFFLKGYLSGDGHFTENKISCTTISSQLSIQIGIILSKMYKKPYSIVKAKERDIKIEGRDVHCKSLYSISITLNPKYKQNFYEDGYAWGRVLKNEKILREIEVYNISVEEDESYLANGVIVHNCTFLSGSGVQWLSHPDDRHLPLEERRPHPKYPNRMKDMLDSVEFVKNLYNCNIKHVAIENPVGLLSSRWRKPDQSVHPWMFGDKASKNTCLWLKNLPKLTPTDIVSKGEQFTWIDKKGKQKSQPMWYYESLKNAKTKEERQTLRSKTFPGIAKAIAQQYSKFLLDEQSTTI